MEKKAWWKMSFQNKFFIKLVFVLSFLTLVLLIWHGHVVKSMFIFPAPRINIILVEAKHGKRNLSSREACSVESAAFNHPDARITLYNVNGRNNESDENEKNLVAHYPRIHFRSLNISEIFIGTPLERWGEQRRISESKYPTEHMSDALRLVLLWKHGGLYMDTDTIVIKPFYEFKNAIGLETLENAANGVMIFQKNSSFIYNLMHHYAWTFDGQIWGNQGPVLITKLLKEACNVDWFETVINKPEVCQGIRVLPQKVFYPVAWYNWVKLFEKRTNESADFSQSYAVHLFGSQSRDHLVKTGESVIIETFFQDNCPNTYQLMLKNKYL